MRHFSAGTLGVDQGVTALFAHHESGGEMWTGEGPREVRAAIPFSEDFRTPPVVHLSLSLFDLDQKTNPRADLRTENITRTGFEAVFRTWGDTRVARIQVAWMAIGAVTSDDDWDVD